jgi:hypothetical protein
MQVGNGNFVFNADVTGLQSIKPFNTLSSWGWHTSPHPSARAVKRANTNGLVELLDCAWLHGKALIKGSLPGKTEQVLGSQEQSETVEDWQQRNPHRINLARIGLLWNGREMQQSQVSEVNQVLEMQTGILKSSFVIQNHTVEVDTVVSPLFDVVAFWIRSNALIDGSLQFFIEYPYPKEAAKFETSYMGLWNATNRQKTSIETWGQSAEISHSIDDTTYFTNVRWSTQRPILQFARRLPRQRYVLNSSDIVEMSASVRFSQKSEAFTPSFDDVRADAKHWWKTYWDSGAFVDCTATKNLRAKELQRRVILSQYLMAVNAAGEDPPQESGLVSNSWYGKFQLESIWWHLAHWERWNKWERIGTVIPSIYQKLLNSARKRATHNTTSSEDGSEAGKTITGETLLLQQPHMFYFAELEWLQFPVPRTLAKWKDILSDTAELMIAATKWNASTNTYNLTLPMPLGGTKWQIEYAKNPIFELAYWRFAFGVAIEWHKRQNTTVPEKLQHVYQHLPSYPTQYYPYIQPDIYPSIAGIVGFLPPTSSLNTATSQNIIMNFTHRPLNLSGKGLSLLAMAAVRMGAADISIDLLLDPSFGFDDVGMPMTEVERGIFIPYFPSSGGLLMTVAMLANGWSQNEGNHWPKEWICKAEGFSPGV